VTYEIFLKNSCKPEIRQSNPKSLLNSFFRFLCLAIFFIFGGYFLFAHNQFKPEELPLAVLAIPATKFENPEISRQPNDGKNKNIKTAKLSQNKKKELLKERFNVPWKSITIKSGESLALIFSKLELSPRLLFEITSINKETSALKNLKPGNKIKFQIVNDELLALNYEISFTEALEISKKGKEYTAKKIETKLDRIIKNTSGIIDDSLFLSGEKAGLSANLIMQLVAIYGWDIDFALDIRKGDSFTVIYEEQYKEGRMVVEGPIIAAEFINKEKVIRAFRYLDNSGRNDYYNSNGEAMRKAFLRTPVDFFSRISSKFSFGRKHPVLNKIRAHKGVDYAAPMGTPIKATGDGIVAYVGKNGGFGNTIKLKHGGAYTTVYAHLHRFVKNISRGKKVKQGQIIGYVGQSGLATGPHLHYEFQIHGVHRNPLTVKLPKVKTIKKEVISEFKKSIRPMLAELDRITGKNVLSARYPKSITKEIKMNDG